MIITNKQLEEKNKIFKKELGQELARIRQKNNISTYDLQNQGWRSQQYKAIENGEFNMTISRLFKYCNDIGAEMDIGSTEPLSIRIQEQQCKG